MNIYDISMSISRDTPLWPGDPAVQMERFSRIEDGDGVNVSSISISVHSGTHIDAPYHFFSEGKTIEQLSLAALVGRTQVIVIDDDIEEIEIDILKRLNINWEIRSILFKTRNSSERLAEKKIFVENYVALNAEAAKFLVLKGISLVGVDYLSIGPFTHPIKTHKILLKAGIVILEGLNLIEVPEGEYDLVCLPIKITDSDGAPARAVLIDPESVVR